MGIFTSKEGAPTQPVAEQSPSSPITYCLDQQPSDEQWYLKGWAFAPAQEISAELFLSGKLLSSVQCCQTRHDVFSSFSTVPESLLSGFEFVFPRAVLSRIQSGELQLVLRGSASTEVAWTWNEGATEASDPKAKAPLSDHFSSQSSQVGTVARSTKAISEKFSERDLHILLVSHGNLSAVAKSLRTVFDKFAGQSVSVAPLRGLTLVAENAEDAGQLQQLLEQQKKGKEISCRVCLAEELCSWKECSSKNAESLVFYCDESVVLEYLDFASLLRDFLALPQASVLTPAVFGGKDLLHGPSGLALSEYRQQTEIHGGDIPALYSVSQLAPAWISSTAFLEALEQERFGGAKFGLCLPPEDQGYSYFCDLRQAIVVARGASFQYPETEREQMQYVLSRLVQQKSNAKPVSENTVVLLLDEETVEKGPSSAERRQLLALAEQFASTGSVHVEFVADAELVAEPYFGSFSVRPLQELLEG